MAASNQIDRSVAFRGARTVSAVSVTDTQKHESQEFCVYLDVAELSILMNVSTQPVKPTMFHRLQIVTNDSVNVKCNPRLADEFCEF